MNNPITYQIIVYVVTPYVGNAFFYVSKMVITRAVTTVANTLWKYATTPSPPSSQSPPPQTPPQTPPPPSPPPQTPPPPPQTPPQTLHELL